MGAVEVLGTGVGEPDRLVLVDPSGAAVRPQDAKNIGTVNTTKNFAKREVVIPRILAVFRPQFDQPVYGCPGRVHLSGNWAGGRVFRRNGVK